MARHLLKRPDAAGQVLQLRPGSNRLGRNPTNELRIMDPSVSSFHCEITVSGSAVLVRDLGSTNGTFIEHDLVQERALKPGQTLRLGEIEFLFVMEFDPDEPVVSIPELSTVPPPLRPILSDGSRACLLHPATAAIFECLSCHNTFCEECIRTVGVRGGKSMHFCLNCDGKCQPLESDLSTAGAEIGAGRSDESFLGRLSQTLRLPFRR